MSKNSGNSGYFIHLLPIGSGSQEAKMVPEIKLENFVFRGAGFFCVIPGKGAQQLNIPSRKKISKKT
jgi:hypothetical protein